MQENKQLPSEMYQQAVTRQSITSSEDQQQLIPLFDQLHIDLADETAAYESFWQRCKQRFIPPAKIKGIYLWGDVGRGKTLLMDMFYESLPREDKKRLHFHRFMQTVHQQLKLQQVAGKKNPLVEVAKYFRAQAKIICFDEFYVSDVTDAMIMRELLTQLFLQDVILVATSNIHPEYLYKNGVQRDRFLPAIELVKENCNIVQLGGSLDYRLRCLTQAGIYYSPLSQSVKEQMTATFTELVRQAILKPAMLKINDRDLLAIACFEGVVWFDYPQLCVEPRSQYDYIELARQFHTVFVSQIPVFTEVMEDQARRFVSLVDEFYDRNVKLVISAAAIVPKLYQGRLLVSVFQRTQSRLIEMQSHEYLAKAHLA